MEEHGEMPSAGPIISGIKPPQDGWKYVTKSAYMMMGENEVKILAADGSDAQVWIQINSLEHLFINRHWIFSHQIWPYFDTWQNVIVWSCIIVANHDWHVECCIIHSGGSRISQGDANLLFCEIFPKTVLKIKKIDSEGGARPKVVYVDRPLIRT